MTIKDLIDKLKVYDPKMPVCIDDYMGFVEAYEDCIKVEKRKYKCYPFTENDEFEYINLKSKEFD